MRGRRRCRCARCCHFLAHAQCWASRRASTGRAICTYITLGGSSIISVTTDIVSHIVSLELQMRTRAEYSCNGVR